MEKSHMNGHTKASLIKPGLDFPGGPGVKNTPANAEDGGSIPSQGTKIPCATGQLSPCAQLLSLRDTTKTWHS